MLSFVDWGFLWSTLLVLAGGVPLTLQLTMISVLCGWTLATIIALAQYTKKPLLLLPSMCFIELIRGTPLLVQLLLIYYGFAQFHESLASVGLWSILSEPYWCALFGLTLNTAAYGAVIIRGALLSISACQIKAAQAAGMTSMLMFRRVIFPQALRNALPACSNEVLLIVKATSVTSFITLAEITKIAHDLISETYRINEIFLCAGLIYLTINFIIVRMFMLLESALEPRIPLRSTNYSD